MSKLMKSFQFIVGGNQSWRGVLLPPSPPPQRSPIYTLAPSPLLTRSVLDLLICPSIEKSITVIYFSGVGSLLHHTSAEALAKMYVVSSDKHRSISRVTHQKKKLVVWHLQQAEHNTLEIVFVICGLILAIKAYALCNKSDSSVF